MASSVKMEKPIPAQETKHDVSPVERAKKIAGSLARSEKDAHWLRMRMIRSLALG